jgi:hypothetical protein
VRSSPTPTETDASRGYETRDVSLRALVTFAALIAALIAGSLGGLSLLWRYYQERLGAANAQRESLAEADQLPPRPRLQNTPARDYEEFRREQEAALSQYRWIDGERGIVQIPVARAMDIALEKGVGSLSRENDKPAEVANPRKTRDPLAPPTEEGQP